MEYAAFLLGINVGKRQVQMAALKTLMEGIGCKNVKTILASGNARFESDEKDHEALERKISAAVSKKFGFPVGVVVRPLSFLQKLVASNPFKRVPMTKQTRLYVTFFAEKPAARTFALPDRSVVIHAVRDDMIIWHIAEGGGARTPDVMTALVKQFKVPMTTRNWNTVVKIAQ